jgi:hypothetical protein
MFKNKKKSALGVLLKIMVERLKKATQGGSSTSLNVLYSL